jgi:hypothetical protein
MAALSISRAWEETKARIAVDGKHLCLVAAALVALPQALLGVLAPPQQLSGVSPPAWVDLAVLVAACIGFIGQIAIVRLALGPGSVGEAIGRGAKRLLPVLGTLFIIGFAIGVVAIIAVLLVVPADKIASVGSGGDSSAVATAAMIILIVAMLVGARFLMLTPVAAAEAGGSIHILKRSWALGKGHYLRFLGLTALLIVAVLLISMAALFGIGTVILLIFEISPLSVGALLYALAIAACQSLFAIILCVMLARLYLQLAGREPAGAGVPRSGT